MNVFILLIPAFLLYFLAQRFYAPFLGKIFGEDGARPTPAVVRNDGVDYVPTKPHVLFAHHFSAIAAAGPILGPTWALLYGYIPAFFWIVFGAILIGAVHDYACLFVSMREGGKSLAEVARKILGVPAFILFALFIVFNLVVVNAVFINLTAVSLTSMRPPEALGLSADQTLFRTVLDPVTHQSQAVVGGIASTSAIFLTILAPLLGFFLVKRNLRQSIAYPLATFLCLASVWIGFVYPVNFSPLHLGSLVISPVQVWILLIAVYVWLAAAVPVWVILQPREFVSVQFLYLGIFLLAAALVGVGLKGVPIAAPPADLMEGEKVLGSIWPALFITIACGAISGFHGLVAAGTTSKQIAKETDAKNIGYTAMLGESALALCVTLAIAVGVSHSDYLALLVKPVGAPAQWTANPVLAFSIGVAGICEAGLGIPRWLGIIFGLLMVEGFVLDTLDVSIRLNRYLLEEIWSVVFYKVPKVLQNFWINSGISVLLMLGLAYGNTAQNLWPIFGTGNQLLAALSLLTVSVWCLVNRRKAIYVLIPGILVGVTTLSALVYLLVTKYWPARNYLLAITDLLFLILALGVIGFVIRSARRARAALASTQS